MVHDHTETCREQALAALRDAQARVDDLQQQEYQSRLARARTIQLAREHAVTWDDIAHTSGLAGRGAAQSVWSAFLGADGMPEKPDATK